MTYAIIFRHDDGAGVEFTSEKHEAMEFRALIERSYPPKELTLIEVRVETEQDYLNVLEVVKKLEKGHYFSL